MRVYHISIKQINNNSEDHIVLPFFHTLAHVTPLIRIYFQHYDTVKDAYILLIIFLRELVFLKVLGEYILGIFFFL
jgi:hypothetical protein